MLCQSCSAGEVGECAPCPFEEAHDNAYEPCEKNCCAACRDFCRQEI